MRRMSHVGPIRVDVETLLPAARGSEVQSWARFWIHNFGGEMHRIRSDAARSGGFVPCAAASVCEPLESRTLLSLVPTTLIAEAFPRIVAGTTQAVATPTLPAAPSVSALQVGT